MSSHLEPVRLAAYLRVASLAVALYDFLQCIPASYRIYKTQWYSPRPSVSFALFFLIQLTSIIALTSSNVAFFAQNFSKRACDYFYMIPPIFKFVQGLVSQLILGTRTYNLSQRSKAVGIFLLLFLAATSSLCGIAILYRREEEYIEDLGNCQVTSATTGVSPWVFHLVSMIYDLTTTLICMGFLYKLSLSRPSSLMSKLMKMMFYDGLGYYVALTAVNLLNLMLYRAQDDIRTAGASLGYCVTWIMSSRLLIHLNKASRDRRRSVDAAEVTITQTIDSSRQISRAMRSQFEQKNPYDLTMPDFDLDTIEERQDDIGSVEVRIERTVKLERNTSTKQYQLEDYSRPSTSRSRGGQ